MIETSPPVPGTRRDPFVFACPVCHGQLDWLSPETVRCSLDGLTFGREAGIWRFLPPERAAALAQFRQEYETVRRSEGRGSDDPAFYRALPFVGGNGTQINTDFSLRPSQLNAGWGERARSFVVLVDRVIRPLESKLQRPLRILDLGAGNGWLSNRLAARGHTLAAVDLGVNKWDGLGAHRHYETDFICLQAEFDHLPLDNDQADLVIFNASLHYSVNYEVTLREALRLLKPGGQVVVLDTAVYQHPFSGQQMVAEREAAFLQQYGFASNALPSENFLTWARLDQLVGQLGLHWRKIDTVPVWRQWVRRAKVAIRRQREPAQFPLLIFIAADAKSAEIFERSGRGIKDFANMQKDSSSFSSVISVANRIGRNVGWLFAARVGQQAILLLFTALVARQLGDVGLGQLAWVTAVLYIGNIFSTWGLDTVLLRQIGAERRTGNVPLASALLLELTLAMIFMVALFLLPFPGQSSQTIVGLRLYAWVLLPLAVLTLTNAALRGYEQMGWLAGLMVGTAVLQVAGTAVLLVDGGTFVYLIGWLLVVQLIAAGASWWLCRRVLPNFGLNWRLLSWQAMRQLAQVGFWLALLMVTAVLLQRLGILLLGWLGTEAQTGQLAAALRLVEAARLLPGAVMGAMFPVLARGRSEIGDWRLENDNLQSPISNYRWGLLAYGFLAAAALTLLARPLVNLLFGDGYETAVSLLRILAWGVLPFTLSLPLSVELVVAGAEKLALLATFVVLLGTAVLTTIAFSQQGVFGVAMSLVAGEWLLLVGLFMVRQERR